MLKKKQRVVFVLWLEYCLLKLHLIPAVISIYLAIHHLEKTAQRLITQEAFLVSVCQRR